jgi:hypothetical protein
MDSEKIETEVNSKQIIEINEKIDKLTKIIDNRIPKLLYYFFIIIVVSIIGVFIVVYTAVSSFKIAVRGIDFTKTNAEKFFKNAQHTIDNFEYAIKQINTYFDKSKKPYTTREIEINNSPYESKGKADKITDEEIDMMISPDTEIIYNNKKE